MSENLRQRIFLSHKTEDKPIVLEFEQTLAALGFDTWLDTKEMSAGLIPHRAISEGFKASCAAVFFITPAFMDESWIRAEIDHAIDEERQKGERFRIITLVFRDEATGKTGKVPESLKRFVFKEPKSWLEALRDIIDALPVHVGLVGWKDETLSTAQKQILHEVLDESKDERYTAAKRVIAEWANQHSDSFQKDQVLDSGNFAPKLMKAWREYDSDQNRGLHDARGIYNKYWNRLVATLERDHNLYHYVFETIGDNLKLMSVTQPLEILLTEKQKTIGKPNLSLLLTRFQEWLISDVSREQSYRTLGFRVLDEAKIWTQCWPWSNK